MSNLKPAPFFLTPQVVRACLHDTPAKRMANVVVQSLPEYGARIADIRLAILKTYWGSEPGYPSDDLLKTRAACSMAEMRASKAALKQSGYLSNGSPIKLTPAGHKFLIKKKVVRAAKLQPISECKAGGDSLPRSQRGGKLSSSPHPVSLANNDKNLKALRVPSARDVTTEPLSPALSVKLEDRVASEDGRVSGGIQVASEPSQSDDNRARNVVAPQGKPEAIPASQKEAPKADWITKRRERLAAAIAFLKLQGIAVQTHNRDADIKVYLVSSHWGVKHLAEEIVELAIEKGWSE